MCILHVYFTSCNLHSFNKSKNKIHSPSTASMSQYTPEYYAAKTEKYKALHATSESSFDAKLAKKQAHLQFWRANYQLWSYRGCMTRDVIPDDCDEAACEQRVFATFRKYTCKVQLMNTVVRG